MQSGHRLLSLQDHLQILILILPSTAATAARPRETEHLQNMVQVVILVFLFASAACQMECGTRSVGDEPVDCSAAPVCLQQLQDNLPLQPIPSPPQNCYQCYETCVASPNHTSTLHRCEARASSPNPRSTEVVSGPFHLRQYSVHHLRSPHSGDSGLYPNSHLCKYQVKCAEQGAYLSVSLSGLDLEPDATHCPDSSVCRDSLHLLSPTGSECTLCGSDLVCHDTRQPLDSLLLLNGRPGLHLTFQSNTGGRGCGFRLLATCVRRTFFESSNCSVPEPLPPPTLPTPFPPNFSKRDATNSSVAEGNDTRPRRYFNQNSIQVPGVGRVVYEDNTVSVMIGNTLVHEFPGMAVLQVYNDIEGSLTLYGSSNGRSFPGYGVLSVGLGIVLYIQESVPSQFKPTEVERKLIHLLHRGIQAGLEEEGAGRCGVAKLTEKERAEVVEAALEYSRACNGFLRAAACAYQQLNMVRVTPSCLAEIPFPFEPLHLSPHPLFPPAPGDQSGSGLSD